MKTSAGKQNVNNKQIKLEQNKQRLISNRNQAMFGRPKAKKKYTNKGDDNITARFREGVKKILFGIFLGIFPKPVDPPPLPPSVHLGIQKSRVFKAKNNGPQNLT